MATRANHKLAFKYFGPYRIIEKIGQVAYKLELPATSATHPVFHVSQLKPAASIKDRVCLDLPGANPFPQVPGRILQRRLVNRRTMAITQVLVKWSATPTVLATWEDAEALRQRFPFAPA